jgi:hypothetical protein
MEPAPHSLGRFFGGAVINMRPRRQPVTAPDAKPKGTEQTRAGLWRRVAGKAARHWRTFPRAFR